MDRGAAGRSVPRRSFTRRHLGASASTGTGVRHGGAGECVPAVRHPSARRTTRGRTDLSRAAVPCTAVSRTDLSRTDLSRTDLSRTDLSRTAERCPFAEWLPRGAADRRVPAASPTPHIADAARS
ncbi:pentapeptide repeat-containing protein, partial [Microbacterium sp. MYb43]|uniref:pentapeptide repeat-containing protein n=3 Tax=unclassified Microbacterium TaxID=2609290 RepID=UPI0011AFED5B